MTAKEIINEAIKRIREQSKKAGIDTKRLSDEEIWRYWWGACVKGKK